MGFDASLLTGASVPTAAQGKGGGGDGTITGIDSTDGTVVVTHPTGPVVDLSVGGVKTIESTDGSITITNPTGATTNLVVTDKTPGVVGKFTGAVVAGEGAAFGYLGDPGGDLALGAPANVDPQLYQTSARTIAVLRLTAVLGNGFTVPFSVTLYKNGAPTAQTVSVPAGTLAGAKFADAGHPIAFAAGDTFDVRWDIAASGGSPQTITVVLEGPGSGSGAGIAGYSWLSTQLGRANAMLPGGAALIDSPWYTDFLVNPGLNNGAAGIEWSAYFTGATPSAVPIKTKPGGVQLIDTGTTAGSDSQIGTPNSDAFILVNPAAGAFYISSRCILPATTAHSAGANQIPLYAIDASAQEDLFFGVYFPGGVPTYRLAMGTATTSVIVTSTATVDTVNAHDYGIGFDGTTVTGYIDGVPVPGLSTTDLSALTALTLRVVARVYNGTDAASVQIYVDAICCLQRSMQ